MPLFSAFAPLGQLAFSGREPRAQSIYNSIVNQQGGDGVNFTFAQGSRQDCTAYAQAMGIARASLAMTAAGNQMVASKTTWMLDNKEHEYGLVPEPNDDIPAREAALSARRASPAGASAAQVTAALSTLLGTDFYALRATKSPERVLWPTNLGDAPMNLRDPRELPKTVQLLTAISLTGVSSTVFYKLLNSPVAIVVKTTSQTTIGLQQKTFAQASISAAATTPQRQAVAADPTTVITLAAPTAYLQVGDRVTVGLDNLGLAEVVTVTAVFGPVNDQQSFTAVFTNAHDPNSLGRVGNFPIWVSNQRNLLVIVKPTICASPEKLRKIDELMARMSHATTTWSVVASLDGTTTGPFVLDQSPLDQTTFDAISFP